jgi:hypothetical protein
VPPLLGRPVQPADEMQGAEPVVVLGYDVWQRQFLQDLAIIGRVVTVGRTALRRTYLRSERHPTTTLNSRGASCLFGLRK